MEPEILDAQKPREDIVDIVPSLKLDIDDQELVKLINRMLGEANVAYEKNQASTAENERYWVGKQLEDEKLRRGSAKIVDNRIFLSTETIIPIMTSRPPEPTVRLKNGELREKVKQMLLNLWEIPTDDDDVSGMQANMEMMARHWMIYKIGMLKYEYDADIDDIHTSVVRPNKLRIDPLGTNIDKCRFVAEYKEDTVDGLIAKFPGKKAEILGKIGKESLGSKLEHVEFWTNDYVAYKFQDIILEKKKNPNFDYGDMGGDVKFNLFRKPRKPYLPLSVFNLGKSVIDDTCLIEQTKTLQDAVNRKKRNIADNAADNGVLVGSGDHIDKKVLESYTGAPDEKLFVKDGSVTDAITRIPPKQMPAFVFNDLLDDKAEIDNIFGAHSTTRGERAEPKTLGEAQLLRQGDMGRIDLFSRSLDRISQGWYTAMIHMRLVFWTEPHEITSNDEEGTTIIFDRQEFVNPETNKLFKISIKVKPGSAMSIDKDERRAEAMELWGAKAIDPISLFARLDYPNPQEMARKLYIWMTNPIALFPDLMAQQQQAQQQQAMQEIQQGAGVPLKEGMPLTMPDNLQIGAPPITGGMPLI